MLLAVFLKREIAPPFENSPPKIVRWEVDHLILDGITLWISVQTFFFDHLFLEGKTLWVSVKTFFCFLEITFFWSEKRSEFASIQLKTHENSGQLRLRLNQEPPTPLRNPGYATVLEPFFVLSGPLLCLSIALMNLVQIICCIKTIHLCRLMKHAGLIRNDPRGQSVIIAC